MAKVRTPDSLGFAEFAAKLIEETFEAVAASELEQERRNNEFLRAAELDSEAFAELMVPPDAVADELCRLFPSDQTRRPHAVYTGAPYSPAQAGRPEWPAFRGLLGIALERRDYTVSLKRGIRLKRIAVDRISRAVRLQLAAGQQDAIRQSLQRGIPRLVVDSGSVSAKLTFQLVRIEDTDTPDIRSMLAAPVRPLSEGPGTHFPELHGIRLLVRNANDRSPQSNRLQADVFGEVRITFKTVT
jgi:hypothetical protein